MAVEVEAKLLVVVGILEGRGFPSRPGHWLVVEARLAGESLQSDPVDHSNRMEITTELAWEMTKRVLQQHKLQRTPIKLVCFSVDKSTRKKQEVGYVLLDLRSVQQQVEPQVTHWYGLLNSQYSGKRPELNISLTTEMNSTYVSSSSENSSMAYHHREERVVGGGRSLQKNYALTKGSSPPPPPVTTASPAMMLDQSNGWYVVGPASLQQLLHTVSLTLSKPQRLHKLTAAPSGPYHFRYSLLGNVITTETFNTLVDPCDFCPERASVRVKATSKQLCSLLAVQPDTEVVLCNEPGDVLGSGIISLGPLATSSSMTITCPLTSLQRGRQGACVEVLVTLEEEITQRNSAGGSAMSPPPSFSAPNEQQRKPTPARRNLAQSLEEASRPSSSSSSSMVTPPRAHTPTTQPITAPSHLSPSPATQTPVTPPHRSIPHPAGPARTSPTTLTQQTTAQSPIQHTRQPLDTTSVPITTVPMTSVPITTVPMTSASIPSIPVPLTSVPVFSAPMTNVSTNYQAPHQSWTHPLAAQFPTMADSTTTNHISAPPLPSVVQVSSIAQQQREYQAAMELEMWKMSQEQIFMQQLKDKEMERLRTLGEEFQKRDRERENLMKQKVSHYKVLEKQLTTTLAEVEVQRHRLREREQTVSLTQRQLAEERKRLERDGGQQVSQLRNESDARLEVERMKSRELVSQIERLKKQLHLAEEKSIHKDAEFESYRELSKTKPESRLQTELSLIQMEKNELEQKVQALTKSKQHYKEEWAKALKEIATLRQKEQSSMKEQLHLQHQELEDMRKRFLEVEEQHSLQKQLGEIKMATQRLHASTIARGQHLSHHPSSLPAHPDVDRNIARWIEERDILFQTGVYTNSDPTIQKLDEKIRTALAARSSQ